MCCGVAALDLSNAGKRTSSGNKLLKVHIWPAARMEGHPCRRSTVLNAVMKGAVRWCLAEPARLV